jgi:hypothetical protein
MQGWHFLPNDRRMQFGQRLLVEVGKTYKAVGLLKLCENGMHASKRIIDALKYAPGAICCKVELSGIIIEDTDKAVARARHVFAMIDAAPILHEFACLCAENALKLIPPPIDSRLPAAIMAKRDWLDGKITTKELAAASAAARDAASAAWDAASAAGSAARDAATAASAAARDAASAASAAATAAAWDAQNKLLTTMVEAEMAKG